MMKNDEELGLYNEPFDNPLIKESSVAPQNVEEMMSTTNSDIIESIPSDDDVSDWDVTLMDGLEDEEPLFTEQEIENILQEEPTEDEIQGNFSTIERETENIFQNNINPEFEIPVQEGWEVTEEEFDGFVSEPVVTPIVTPEPTQTITVILDENKFKPFDVDLQVEQSPIEEEVDPLPEVVDEKKNL
jgi:hypothetical protein